MAIQRSFLLLLFLVFASVGCKQYHDVAARYNAYFLAKEKMKEVDYTLYGAPQDNYHDVIDVLVPLDSNYTRSQKAGLDYVVEKGSLPIQFHESSDWAEHAYNELGKARLYQEDYVHAVNTFKYVNVNADDPNARHTALVWLMRTFLEKRELNNFQMVREHISDKETEPFNEENLRDFHLIMAQYHKEKDNYEVAAQHLEFAIPNVKGLYTKDKKARLYYILGQMYEKLGQHEAAYGAYKNTLKKIPPYELWFHAKLKTGSLGQTIESESEKYTQENLEEARERLLKMLNDEKNFDMRDKVYYEMALLEHRNDSLNNTFSFLNESVQVSTVNKLQKGYSYLLSGQLYYDEVRDFERAAAYYDSAANSLDKTVRDYDQIKEKAEILKEMVKYLQQIRENERLIRLSKMSEAELDSVLNAEIEAEKEAIIKKEENLKMNEQKRKRNVSASSLPSSGDPDASWYFYNPQRVIQGKSNFLRTWGSRPLENDWRRSRKPSQPSTRDRGNVPTASLQGENNKKGGEDSEEPDMFASVKSVEDRIKEIPQSDDALEENHLALQDGLFNLGKVYLFKLKEDPNAHETFVRLLEEYPFSEFSPEAAYLLMDLCMEYPECTSEQYRQLILTKYPDSFYGKILKNPNYVRDTNEENEAAKALYQQAFALYEQNRFEQATAVLEEAALKHPQSPYEDKMAFLEVMIVGKTTSSFNEYNDAIEQFAEQFPESPLVELARNFQKEIDSEELEFDQVPGRYKYEPDAKANK